MTDTIYEFQPSLVRRIALFLYALSIIGVLTYCLQKMFWFGQAAGSGSPFGNGLIGDLILFLVIVLLAHWSVFKILQLNKLASSPDPSVILSADGVSCRIKGAPEHAFIAWQDIARIKQSDITEPYSILIYPTHSEAISVRYYGWYRFYLRMKRSCYRPWAKASLSPHRLVISYLVLNISHAELCTYMEAYRSRKLVKGTYEIAELPGIHLRYRPVASALSSTGSVERVKKGQWLSEGLVATLVFLPVLTFCAAAFFEVLRFKNDPQAVVSQELLHRAHEGDSNAQNQVAVRYSIGQGFPRSDEIAVIWFKKAADLGQADAQYNLGIAYQFGRGVGQNYRTAAHWFVAAVNQDVPAAYANLGYLFMKGLGVAQSDESARDLYRRGVAHEEHEALYFLGFLHEHGRAVERSTDKARRLYERAAKQNNPRSLKALKRLEALAPPRPK